MVRAYPEDNLPPDQDDKVKAPIDQYKDIEPGPMQIAPDGGIMLTMGQPAAVPPATPDNFVCLRGPCRHYWRMETFMASGNPKGTWGPGGLKDEHGKPVRVPRQINHTCLAHPGTETELTEDCVFVCNKWDPLLPSDLADRIKRQDKYFKLHPNHLPTKED